MFHRCAAELLSDILAEERRVGEAEDVGNLLDGVFRGAKIIVDVGYGIFLYPLQSSLTGMLLADQAQIFW